VADLEDRDLIKAAGRVAAAADALGVVFEQRDFSPWNVHIGRDGALIVFDWESAEPAGFPLLDLVYLLAYAGFLLDRALESGRVLESYRSTLASPVAEECMSQYCSALAIDPNLLPGLRTLTWLVHLRSALQRDSSEADAALFLELLREEVMRAPLADAAQ
jgi:aminoglycoside phosphotransferase (APT) family kinase protein